MTNPFQEIADTFKAETGCEMNITFANAAQIQTQIQTTNEGDFFIAGSADELKPVEEFVEKSEDLVKHIPVIAVPTANPKGIASLADLAKADTLLIGDPESTPIGKIAKKALTDVGAWDGLQQRGAITTTTTAPQIATALASGEGDAGIVWKENVKADGATILDTKDMDPYVKTVPAALLKCVADANAANEFLDFLESSTAQEIWEKHGYELV
jgi:molybdate transport system substrate-binding protein